MRLNPQKWGGQLAQWSYYSSIDIMSTLISQDEIVIDWKAVGRRIRELRGFDKKQSDVADAIGVAQSHISAIERGQKESGVLPLLKIARYYGKSIEWLLTGSDSKSG
jgi:DNA-binding XRE family transcriptional regulator